MAIVRILAQGFGFGQNGGTSSVVDTTGCDFLVAGMEGEIAGSSPTVTDSKGNTWHILTISSGSGFTAAVLFWCVPTSVGTGHTFTFNPPLNSGSFPGCFISGFSGVDQTSPLDHDAGNGGNSSSSNTWTPGVAGALVVGLIANFTGNITSVASPLTFDVHQPLTGGVNYDGATSYVIQTTAISVVVNYSSGSGRNAVAAASFKPAGGGGGTVVSLTLADSFSLSDSLTQFLTATQISLSDALSLSDRIAIILNLPFTFSDTLSFSDAFADLIGIAFNLNDTISLLDFLVVYFILAKQLNDNLLFSDTLNAVLADNPAYSDTLSLSDAAKIQLSLGLGFTDSLSFLDSLQLRLSNNLLLPLSDTLSISDSLALVLSGDLDSYIRHYLNDVPN